MARCGFYEPVRRGRICHRAMARIKPSTGAFKAGGARGPLEKILLALAQHLQAAGGLDLKECFVDGTFVPAKRGGGRSGQPNAAKAPRSWVLPTAIVFLSPYGQKVLPRLK